MPGEAVRTRARAFGEYGLCLDTVIDGGNPADDEVAICGRPPEGYTEIERIICSSAVFLIAAQASYITAYQANRLRTVGIDVLIRTYFHNNYANAVGGLVTGPGFPNQFNPSIYWMYRHDGHGADLFSKATHTMVALDGALAAGSNNALVTPAGHAAILFATHDLRHGLTWDAGHNCWISVSQNVYVDILATPMDILETDVG